MGKTLSYYGLVASRAALDLSRSFWIRFVCIEVFLFAVGFVVFVLWKGWVAAVSEWQVFLSFILAPAGAAAILVAIWKIITTPPRIYDEKQQVIDKAQECLDDEVEHPAIAEALNLLNGIANGNSLSVALAELVRIMSKSEFQKFCTEHGIIAFTPADPSAEAEYQLVGGKGEDEILSGLRGWIVVHEHDLSIDQLNLSFIGSLAHGTPHSPPPAASSWRP